MFVLCLAIVVLLGSNIMAFKLEPSSCSSFHYEEQTLEKMIRLQIFVEKMKEEMDSTKVQVRDGLNSFATEREQFLTEIQELKDGLATTKADQEADLPITKMQESIKQLTNDVLKIKESAIEPVAFQSSNVEDMAMTDKQVIVFTSYTINYGESYDTKTGTFTVPIGGIYMFAVQLSLTQNSYAYFGIYVNETLVQTGLIGDQDRYNIFTLVTIADVHVDDRVTVQCTSSCSDGNDSLYRETYTKSSFSGVLIRGK